VFTHLHVHTEYSLLDGLCQIPPMVQQAKKLGMQALAMTDHGGLYDAVEFYQACKEAGIKPIIGCELYVAKDSRHSKAAGDKQPYHLVALAKNNTGYQNLMQLVSKAHLEGFYYKPRVDRELLEKHREGLIILSACLNGEVARLLSEGFKQEAYDVARWYKQTFGPDYYVELQRHDRLEELERVNAQLLALARELDIPLVATNDFHYLHREDAPIQDVLICIHTSTTVNDDKRLKMDGDSYYMKSAEEMQALFADLPEALANTERIAEQCNVSLQFGTPHLPKFTGPKGEDADTYLRQLCWAGLQSRLPDAPAHYRERLDYELDVIAKTRFPDYFLVVRDIAMFARQAGILFGVRGSAASSLVLYCIGVTDVDPMPYNLVFERFLNLERKEMPDIDMDFQDDRRDEVLHYIVKRYGPEHVAQIITFGTMGPKAAIRDTARALGMSYADGDRVARLVPFRARTLDDALEEVAELCELIAMEPQFRKLVETAKRLEGVVHHASTHAAGVVISSDPLVKHVPLQRPVRGTGDLCMTQYAMDPVAKLGLLKMDILGLANLTILRRAVEAVERTRGVTLVLQDIPLDDQNTFDLLSRGDTGDVFQLESEGMRRYIKQLKPNQFNDLVAMVALYRPGPMEHIPRYIQAKHGEIEVTHPHPVLKEILDDTYGVIVYQDQVLFIVRAFAGYSLGQADIVRKAMGKKDPVIMAKERDRFLKGALEKGFSPEEAQDVFDLILPFAGYAFNKAHSVSYALLAYWTAYFKANYPAEYMLAVLNTRAGNLERVGITVSECGRLGVPVLPPDINRSGVEFTIEPLADGRNAIRFGMAFVKNVGDQWVRTVVEERAKGPFASVPDFFRRIDRTAVNRRALEGLVKVGAFDALGVERGALLASLDRLLAVTQRETRLRKSGQVSLFGAMGAQEADDTVEVELAAVEPTSASEKREWEREHMGVSLTDNPLLQILPLMSDAGAITATADLDADAVGSATVTVGGEVTGVREMMTKDKKTFLIGTLTLADGEAEVVAWPSTYERVRDVLAQGALVYVTGKLRDRDGRVSLVCDDAQPYREGLVFGNADQSHAPAYANANGRHANGSNGNGKSANGAGQYVNGNGSNGHATHDHPAPGASRVPREAVRQNPAPASADNTAPVAVTPIARTLVLRLRESGSPASDKQRLKRTVQTLLDHARVDAQDRVLLEMVSKGKRVRMEAPFYTTYCPELHTALEELLGSAAVKVEGL
jgi:DNA polymerase-3 subunit alpha